MQGLQVLHEHAFNVFLHRDLGRLVGFLGFDLQCLGLFVGDSLQIDLLLNSGRIEPHQLVPFVRLGAIGNDPENRAAALYLALDIQIVVLSSVPSSVIDTIKSVRLARSVRMLPVTAVVDSTLEPSVKNASPPATTASSVRVSQRGRRRRRRGGGGVAAVEATFCTIAANLDVCC